MAAERDRWPPGKQVTIVFKQFASLAPVSSSTQLLTSCLLTGKIAKEYEAKGGDYENQPGSKNKAKKGAPEHKDDSGKLKAKEFSRCNCVQAFYLTALLVQTRH